MTLSNIIHPFDLMKTVATTITRNNMTQILKNNQLNCLKIKGTRFVNSIQLQVEQLKENLKSF